MLILSQQSSQFLHGQNKNIMQKLQESLEAILQRHFSIVPARTNRHDQWYKRSYQS